MNDTTYEPLADEAIRLYRLCKEFNHLPRSGGILDQDYLQIILMEQVADAVNEKERIEANKAKSRR